MNLYGQNGEVFEFILLFYLILGPSISSGSSIEPFHLLSRLPDLEQPEIQNIPMYSQTKTGDNILLLN